VISCIAVPLRPNGQSAMRDDFSPAMKEVLAKRVGFRCSNPACRQLTSGPQVDVTKAVNVGVASHITAASPGGPRYDASLTPDERSHPNNGVWLCQKCGKLVDNDAIRYTQPLLREWKSRAEGAAIREVEGGTIQRTALPQDNPLHRIIDLLTKYHNALWRVHHADTQETRLTSLEEWRCCHPAVWGASSSRDDTIRKLADPAKAWLSQINCRYVQKEDLDLIEESAYALSGFAVSPSPMSMPDIYSKRYNTEDELWQRWTIQGDQYMAALGGLIVRLRDLAGRAGQPWNPSPQAE
jgi:hypothetical protein